MAKQLPEADASLIVVQYPLRFAPWHACRDPVRNGPSELSKLLGSLSSLLPQWSEHAAYPLAAIRLYHPGRR